MKNMVTSLEERENNKKLLIFFSITSIIVGFCIILCFIMIVKDSHTLPKKGEILHLSSFGAFGDFIAGVAGTLFSLAGFFLLYLTLKDQRENFHKERLESNYFEMISFHRDNVNELKYTYFENSFNKEPVTAEKRKVFKLIFTQFKEAWKELTHFFDDEEVSKIYKNEYLEKIKNNQTLNDRKIDLKQYAQLDIIYIIVFFGLSSEDRQTILNMFEDKYELKFIKKIIDFAILKPKKESYYWCQWELLDGHENRIEIFNDIIMKRNDQSFESSLTVNLKNGNDIYIYPHFYPDEYSKYYGGHQFRLGHYYRHFFQTIKFIDKEAFLSYNEKYNYIKILRGQLSNYEQIIFFLNSLSEVGRSWEFEIKNKQDKGIELNSQLITKYNLIKNIPIQKIVDEIDVKKYYPSIEFETIKNNEGCLIRKSIKKVYS